MTTEGKLNEYVPAEQLLLKKDKIYVCKTR